MIQVKGLRTCVLPKVSTNKSIFRTFSLYKREIFLITPAQFA